MKSNDFYLHKMSCGLMQINGVLPVQYALRERVWHSSSERDEPAFLVVFPSFMTRAQLSGRRAVHGSGFLA